MVKKVYGDLLKAKESVIIHQVNCQGKMGSGVALQIRTEFPRVFTYYLLHCKNVENKSELLGQIDFVQIADSPPRFLVNLYAQLNYGCDGYQYTDYNAFVEGLEIAFKNCKEKGIKEVAMPYKIGCCRGGGGNWRAVKEILTNLSETHQIDIILYQLKGD